MARYNKLRDLSFRLKPGAVIFHYNGSNDTRSGIYNGTYNNVIYNEDIYSINMFCINHKKETRPDIKPFGNAWANCYIETIENAVKCRVKLKNVPIINSDLPNIKVRRGMEDNEKYAKYFDKNLDLKIIGGKQCKQVMSSKAKSTTKKKAGKGRGRGRGRGRGSGSGRGRGRGSGRGSGRGKKKAPSQSEIDTENALDPEVIEKKAQKKLEEKRMRQFQKKMMTFWNNGRKEKIIDCDGGCNTVFVIEKLDDETYGMFNQTKQRLGIIRFWKDYGNKIPKEFKNKDNIVSPMGTQAYEYVLEEDSPFHEMPRRIYRKYRYVEKNNEFVSTEEIFEVG
jgi:hypothetical protein